MMKAPTVSRAIEASEADDAARFDQIIELLVAAGYFRARIPALTPFDKVVGGMAWCMTATSVDVDVAFVENATIGQKIKIGEAIERALRQMKCRIPLQAHQVQGLDYAAIFPVVQWLVKQAYAFREEIADATRRLSASHFHRSRFALPSDTDLAARRRSALPAAQELRHSYAPTRRYRRKADAAGAKAAAAVHARRVLMEFGVQLATLGDTDGAGAAPDGGAKAAQRKRQQQQAADGADAGEMADADEGGELSRSRVGKLVRMGASDIQQAAADFARKSEALAASGEMAGVHKLRKEKDAAGRQLEQANKQLARDTAASQAAAAAKTSAEEKRAQASAAITGVASRRAAAEAELAELEKLAADAPQEELARLQALVGLNERMVGQKSEFKKECARQLAEMNAELERLNATSAAAEDDESAKLREIEELYDSEDKKASAMRRLVGQKGREMTLLSRQVDDVPTSAELMQYERRFRELYSQVASKLDETKRYYALFNTLEEKKGYLAKEVSLLNSIHENFTKATSGGGSKDKIVESVEGILKSVQQTLAKVEQRLADGNGTRDAQQLTFDKLVEKQRKYFQLVADYQAECEKNARLSEQQQQPEGE